MEWMTSGDWLSDAELEELYAFPGERRHLVANFVSSVDGAVEVAGRSAGLSNAADRRVYRLGGDLADVRLVGAGTAVAERFRGIRPDPVMTERRQRQGLSPVPPVAVVTGGSSLPAESAVVTDVLTPTIVLTCEAAPTHLRDAWAHAGAVVLVVGDERVDPRTAVTALADRGLRRISCDGGPVLFGDLLAAGVVDELRLTLSPRLLAGPAGRIAAGPKLATEQLHLASVLADGDTLLLRYHINPT